MRKGGGRGGQKPRIMFVKRQILLILKDSNTDTSISVQELVYILFFNDDQVVLMLLSIENPSVADTSHYFNCVREAFLRFAIFDFSSQLHRLNVDGASVDLGCRTLDVVMNDYNRLCPTFHPSS